MFLLPTSYTPCSYCQRVIPHVPIANELYPMFLLPSSYVPCSYSQRVMPRVRRLPTSYTPYSYCLGVIPRSRLLLEFVALLVSGASIARSNRLPSLFPPCVFGSISGFPSANSLWRGGAKVIIVREYRRPLEG
jgi:hypothetical protein